MASINDFVNVNTGKSLDYDGAYGAQCVDLIQFWAQDLGTPQFTGNAIDLVNQTHDGAYTWTPNGPDNFPAPGDIVVWAANDAAIGTGEFGHVDICVNANAQNLTTFDQNWSTVPAHLVHHNNYTGVVGWLHPAILDTPTPTPPVTPTPDPEPTPVPPVDPQPAPTPAPVPTTPPAVPAQPTPGVKTSEFKLASLGALLPILVPPADKYFGTNFTVDQANQALQVWGVYTAEVVAIAVAGFGIWKYIEGRTKLKLKG